MATRKKVESGASKKTSAAVLNSVYTQVFHPVPSKGEVMKEKILSSAIDCIAHHGIEGTTFESIGKPLKIRKSHVAYHFKDKEDIIAAAIRYVIAKGQALTAAKVQFAKTPLEKIHAIAEAFFEWAEKDPKGVSVYHLFYYYCTINKDYQKIQKEIREVGATRLVEVLKQDPQIAKKNSAKDLEILARNIQALGFGALTDLMTLGDMSSEALKDTKVRTLKGLDALLKG